VVDPEQGWSTDRLVVEPLTRAHAAALAGPLDDPDLHTFIGGEPLAEPALAERYEFLAARRSPDGAEVWANWALRERDTGAAVGTLQATLPSAGPDHGPAEVAWVVARAAQRRGYAREAAAGLVGPLHAGGWTVIAHIHPDHTASQRVAHALGLRPTKHVVDDEIRWELLPALP
jgi:RimJ/RimL family protein N-acetyltransferase